MTDEADITLKRLDAIYGWLEDVFGKDMCLSRLLRDAGISKADIEALTTAHLASLITAVVHWIQEATDIHDGRRCKILMLRYYGLINPEERETYGERETFYVIGHSVGVGGERIRQLVGVCVKAYRQPERKTQFIADLAVIANNLLRS